MELCSECNTQRIELICSQCRTGICKSECVNKHPHPHHLRDTQNYLYALLNAIKDNFAVHFNALEETINDKKMLEEFMGILREKPIVQNELIIKTENNIRELKEYITKVVLLEENIANLLNELQRPLDKPIALLRMIESVENEFVKPYLKIPKEIINKVIQDNISENCRIGENAISKLEKCLENILMKCKTAGIVGIPSKGKLVKNELEVKANDIKQTQAEYEQIKLKLNAIREQLSTEINNMEVISIV